MRKVIFAITLIIISSISSIVIEDKSLVLINVSKEESTEKTNNSLNNSIKKSRLGGEPITNYSTSPDWNITLMTASTHSSTPDMSIGDIDNDGHNDLILCVNGGQNRIFSGDGNGTFTLIHQFSGNAKTIKSALLDIDKDGYLDIVFANQLASGSTGAKNVIHMNNNGTFNNSAAIYMNDTDNTIEIQVADFNADGWQDIIFGNQEHNKIHLNRNGTFLNTADWSEPKVIYNATQSEYFVASQSIHVADINGDGILDYITGNIKPTTSFWPTGFYVWLGNGNGTYGTWHEQYSEYYFSWTNTFNVVSVDIALVDLDGDSDLDLIASTVNNASRTPLEHHIYLQNQSTDPLFDKQESWFSNTAKCGARMDIADVDLDGALDVIFGHWPCAQGVNVSTDVYTFHGTWPPSQTPTWTAPGIGWSFDSEFIDIDEDGDLDAVILGSDYNYVTSTREDSRLFVHLNPRLNQDKDNHEDHEDDCPTKWGQSIYDRIACPDTDGDGWSNADVNWTWGMGADRFENNPDQHIDTDGDGWGDNTQGLDGDDCPGIWGNSTEASILGCIDSDGDNWADTIDWQSADKSQWKDEDEDNFGDNPNGTNGDACPGEWGNSTEASVLGCIDTDGDGWADIIDWQSADESQWQDADNDSYGDNPNGTNGDDCPGEGGNSTESSVLGCIDTDGDGWADIVDSHPQEPTQWLDWDGDGYGDNVDGADADDCPTQFGESDLDLLGCMDWDGDGVSNTNDPDPLDENLTFDPDADGIDSSIDNCPNDNNPNQEDFDTDGSGDICDDDDDGDQILDDDDTCALGNNDWTSNSNNDVDGDGCKDLTEDNDDDGDGVADGMDICTNTAQTYTGWISISGTNDSTNHTDWDGDGCEDNTPEDLDDDNDGILDAIDVCPNSPFGWISTIVTDSDSNGCEDITQDSDGDGTVDKFDQCPNTPTNTTTDDRGCSVIQNQQVLVIDNSEEAKGSFSERLLSGDLDVWELILATIGPLSIVATILFGYKRKAHFRRLRKTISQATSFEDIGEIEKMLIAAVSSAQLSDAQYNLLLSESEVKSSKLSIKEETVAKSEEARTKTKEKWSMANPNVETTDKHSIDEDGVEWWEDENGQWWYRGPEDEKWSKWED